jgi:hypothetical protein
MRAECVALALVLFGGSAAAQPVDLALVIAVDVSNSIGIEEQALQRSGYVAAFRHPDIVIAVRSGGLGRIAVAYLEWAGPGQYWLVLPWTLVDDSDSAQSVARALEVAPISRGTGTSISSGLPIAQALLDAAGPDWAMRRVVDISGDGPNNAGPPVEDVRDRIAAAGITVNGLPIHTSGQTGPFASYPLIELERYYASCVTAGPGAFVLGVDEMATLTDAIRQKLVAEIAGAPAATVLATMRHAGGQTRAAAFDCTGPGERTGR